MDLDKIKKSKIALFNSMLKNPNLSRVLDDAINSPIGSTKRQKAKSILSVIKKTNPNKVYLAPEKDGKGGPGSFSYTPTLPTSNTSYGLTPTTFNPKPAPAAQPGDNIFSGAFNELKSIGGDIGSWWNSIPTSTTIFPAAPNLKTNISNLGKVNSSVSDLAGLISGSIKNSALQTNEGNQSNLSSIYPNLSKGSPSSTITGPIMSKAPVTTPAAQSSIPNSKPIVGIGSTSTNNGTTTEKTVTKPDGTVTKSTTSSPAKNIETSTPSEENTGESNISDIGYSTSAKTSSSVSGIKNTGPKDPGLSEAKSSVSTGDISLSDVQQNAQYYIDNNLGAEMYSQDMMKELQGKTLPEQLTDLQSTLKEEYGLSELLAKKNKLSEATPNAVQDMTDYVKGRDQFISKINGLLDKTNDKAASIDMLNPDNANMINSYKQYLTVLKGRQNQQYGTYINKSIDQFNNDIKNIDTQYQNAVDMYNSAYTNEAGITSDNYNNTKKALEEMYNAMVDGPLKLTQLQEAKERLYKLQTDNAGGAVDLVDPYKDISKYKDDIVDKDGNIYDDLDLTGLINENAGVRGFDVKGVIKGYQDGIRSTMANLGASGNISDLYKNSDKYTKQLLAVKDDQNINPDGFINTSLKGAGDLAITKAGEGVNNYILNNYKDIKSAIGKMEGGTKIDDITKKYSNIDKTLLNNIYDYYSFAKSADPKFSFQKTIDMNKQSDPTFASLPAEKQLATYLSPELTQYSQYIYDSNF